MTTAGGLIEIIGKINIKKIVIGKQFEDNLAIEEIKRLAQKNKIQIVTVQKGTNINIENKISIKVLWPDTKNMISENAINNNALVFKFCFNSFSILFTGDIEKEAENILISQYKNILKSNILKVSHHGSKTSSSEEFLELVKPEIALIGVGKDNKFGHPNKEVLDILNNLNCKIYRTDQNGEIVITTRGIKQLKIVAKIKSKEYNIYE